eukprot:UN03587
MVVFKSIFDICQIDNTTIASASTYIVIVYITVQCVLLLCFVIIISIAIIIIIIAITINMIIKRKRFCTKFVSDRLHIPLNSDMWLEKGFLLNVLDTFGLEKNRQSNIY